MCCLFQAKENSILQASLERRKVELHKRRLALEKEVRAQTMGKVLYFFLERERPGRFYDLVSTSIRNP